MARHRRAAPVEYGDIVTAPGERFGERYEGGLRPAQRAAHQRIAIESDTVIRHHDDGHYRSSKVAFRYDRMGYSPANSAISTPYFPSRYPLRDT